MDGPLPKMCPAVGRALPPRRPPQCSCVVIESRFDPGERLQPPGSLWFKPVVSGRFGRLETS